MKKVAKRTEIKFLKTYKSSFFILNILRLNFRYAKIAVLIKNEELRMKNFNCLNI